MKISKYFWILNTSFPSHSWHMTKNYKWCYKAFSFMIFFFGKTKHIEIPYWFKKQSKEEILLLKEVEKESKKLRKKWIV